MTKPQINLLSACVAAHGLWQDTKVGGHALTEVGLRGGHSRRTAQSLVDAGLLDMETNELKQTHVCLSFSLLNSLVKED